ncbi:MAG: MFS transporter [Clostridia bacterium]|nr:MFS transporter [Clostridia bacterium]
MQKSKLDYRWVIAAVCFLIIFTALGFCSSTKALFLKPVTDKLEISRSLFSITDSIRHVTNAVLSLFFGNLVMKFGTKKLACAGLLCLCTAMTIYSFASHIGVFYIGGFFLGIGMSWTGTSMVGYVIGKWFKENRGTVMGAILAANGLGGAVSAQLVSPIIHSGAEGFRNAYRVIALCVFIIFIIALVLFKDQPKGFVDNGEKPSAKKKHPKRAQVWTGIDYKEVRTKPYFWLLLICIFVGGAATNTISSVSSAHFGDVGLDTAFIATALSLHSLALTVSKIAAGFCYDKIGLRFTSLTIYLIGVVSMFMLALVGPTSYGLASAFQILISFALPINTIMLPLYAADMFGEKSYVKIMGMFVAVCTAGYAVGTPFTNLIFDLTGTYRNVSIVYGVVLLVVATVFQIILTKTNKIKAEIISREQAE